MREKRLHSALEFANRLRLFPDVDQRERFLLVSFCRNSSKGKFSFDNLSVGTARLDARCFMLSYEDIRNLSPNTFVCPKLPSPVEFAISQKCYSRFSPLIVSDPPQNSWSIDIERFINVSDWSASIRELQDLDGLGTPYGFSLGWEFAPILEGKMFNQFDHRYATYEGAGQLNPPRVLSDKSPLNYAHCLKFIPVEIAKRRNPALSHQPSLLVLRDISNRTNERGIIASLVPAHVTDYTVRVLSTTTSLDRRLVLLSVLNSFIFDYLARQRIGATHVSNYVVEQTPCPSPDEARNMLWRREARQEGSGKTYPAGAGENSVLVRTIHDDPCVETVLFTDFNTTGKIPHPTAASLAKAAIESVGRGEPGMDGISYLISMLKSGIQTPLTDESRAEILRQSGAGTLQELLQPANSLQ